MHRAHLIHVADDGGVRLRVFNNLDSLQVLLLQLFMVVDLAVPAVPANQVYSEPDRSHRKLEEQINFCALRCLPKHFSWTSEMCKSTERRPCFHWSW